MKLVGVIGSGQVGQVLARGFRKHGYDVRIASRTPAKLSEFSQANGIHAATPADVAAWADTIAANWRAADLDDRHVAMLAFAAKLTETPDRILEADRTSLRNAGFSDRDIWDIAAVAAFFNMSNRVAAATEMRPNRDYYTLGR